MPRPRPKAGVSYNRTGVSCTHTCLPLHLCHFCYDHPDTNDSQSLPMSDCSHCVVKEDGVDSCPGGCLPLMPNQHRELPNSDCSVYSGSPGCEFRSSEPHLFSSGPNSSLARRSSCCCPLSDRKLCLGTDVGRVKTSSARAASPSSKAVTTTGTSAFKRSTSVGAQSATSSGECTPALKRTARCGGVTSSSEPAPSSPLPRLAFVLVGSLRRHRVCCVDGGFAPLLPPSVEVLG